MRVHRWCERELRGCVVCVIYCLLRSASKLALFKQQVVRRKYQRYICCPFATVTGYRLVAGRSFSKAFSLHLSLSLTPRYDGQWVGQGPGNPYVTDFYTRWGRPG